MCCSVLSRSKVGRLFGFWETIRIKGRVLWFYKKEICYRPKGRNQYWGRLKI